MYKFIEGLKSDRAFFFDCGSNALHALFKSARIAEGDEVILQVFTCTSVASAIVRCGATPVYVDIDPYSFNLDCAQIEAGITKRTKAIVVQHTFGVPADMDAIVGIARRHDIWLFEDACHSLGSKYNGQEVGTFGDAAIYSFGWHKPITLGLGGAAIVNDPYLKSELQHIYGTYSSPHATDLIALYSSYLVYAALYSPSRYWAMKEIFRRMRDFASSPRKGSLEALIRGQSSRAAEMTDSQLEAWYETEFASAQSRPSPLLSQQTGQRLASIERRRLFAKLGHWGRTAEYLRCIVRLYRERLAQIGYSCWEPAAHLDPVYYKYPVLYEAECKKRIISKAREKGIELSDMFGSPLYPMERAMQWKALGYQRGMCPVAEDVSARIIALPVHGRVRISQVDRTVALLESVTA